MRAQHPTLQQAPVTDSQTSGAPGVSGRQDRFARAFAPRYQFVRELGSGGMGHVYLCRDSVLERLVAIKCLKDELATAVACERFLREARTLARLDHAHVVHVHDVGEQDGLLYFVMDYLEGPTLRQRLDGGERLTVPQVRALGLELLDALGRAHAMGICHRDLKPSNIFIVDDHAWLTDFGIASDASADGDTLTHSGQLLGTFSYMAPEQRDGRPVDGRADLYALGLVLLEALTGRRPAILDPQAWKSVPRSLALVLQRALAGEPEDRWQDAASFRRALEQVDDAPMRLRGRRLGVAFAALVALFLAVWLAGRESGKVSGGPSRPDDLALLPIDYKDDPRLGWDLTRHVAKAFLPFPLVQVQPPSKTREWLELRGGQPGTAVPAGALRYAEGEVTRRADSLFVTIEVREQGAAFVDQVTAAGDTAQLDRLALAIADSLVAKLAPADLQAFRNIRHRPVQDPIAAQHYFNGEDAFQRGEWLDADREFSAALKRDPRFLQAAWGLMIARRFQRVPFGDVLMALRQAADGLPPLYRGLLEAQLEPDLVARIRRYEALVQAAPGSGEALLHYNNELFHRGALVGRPLAATLDTMSRLAGEYRDLHHASTYDLTIWGNIRLGREQEAWTQFHRRAALVPPDDDFGLFHRYALWARFSPWRAWLMRTLLFLRPDAHTLEALAHLHRLGLTMDVPQTQVEIGALLEQKDSTLWVRRAGTVGQALGLVALGRPSAGLATLDRAAEESGDEEIALQRLEWSLMLAALGLPIDPGRVARAREELVRGPFPGTAGARARFALAVDALARGDSVLARRFADSLGGAREPVSARLAVLLEARLDAMGGAHAESLERSRVVYVLDSAAYQAGPFARAATYLARGESRRALAQWEAADLEWGWYENSDLMGWPEGPPQQGEVDAMLAAYARLLRAELAIEHGDPATACAPLERVAELWRDSEPEWAPLRRRVAVAMERTRCQ